MRKSAIRTIVVLGLAVGALAADTIGADSPLITLDDGAAGGAPATPLPVTSDLVSVVQRGGLSNDVRDRALAAAAAASAPAALARGYTIGLTTVRRGAVVVQQASGPSGVGRWQYPIATTVLPLDAVASSMGREVATALAYGGVVMSQTAVGLRGAQVGDTIDLVSAFGSIATFTIGLVVPDAVVGGSELLITPPQADYLGATIATRVLVYGQFDRQRLEGELAARGLTTQTNVRVVRSWDPVSPDSTLSMAETKVALGEFDYALGSNDVVSVDADWRAANIPATRELYADIALRAACHVAIRADLQAALSEIKASGLAGMIDLTNTNTYGGCFGPRFTRGLGNLGSLSRHSWGQPLDVNTATNCIGCVPTMDCRVVRIFRKHNFAWGGNFLLPDGMHFEWVGHRVDQVQYPSKYCPNLPSPAPPGQESQPATQRARFFADDGWAAE